MESDQRIQLTVIWSKCEPRGHPAYQVAGELETQGEKKKKKKHRVVASNNRSDLPDTDTWQSGLWFYPRLLSFSIVAPFIVLAPPSYSPWRTDGRKW